ncbi:hypothetical protein [Janibacter terrae]|uniref:hypothetical protein n=1 Tax=Janibacter terrae TaxID=103817 RepID=UPI00146D04B3|nr:hypothetical protein [Janibacter terrae]
MLSLADDLLDARSSAIADLLEVIETNLPDGRRPLPGEHIGETEMYAASRTEDGYIFRAELDFRQSRDLDPWLKTLTELEGQPIDLDDLLAAHREKLRRMTRF